MYVLGLAFDAKLSEEFVLAPKSELQNKILKPKDLWNRPHALVSFYYCTTHQYPRNINHINIWGQVLHHCRAPLQMLSISSFRTSVS